MFIITEDLHSTSSYWDIPVIMSSSTHVWIPWIDALSMNSIAWKRWLLWNNWLLQWSLIRSWRFCRKMRFEASQVVFWSLSCYKELKLTTNRFTGRTLRGLLIQMQNISLRTSGMRKKQNFKVFGFKSDTAVLTFTFRFLSSLLFSLFLPHFFVLLLGI